MTLRALSVISVCALALAACDRGAPGQGKARAAYPDCRSDDLTLKLVSDRDKDGVAVYGFGNRSKHICVLRGFPTVTFVGADGRPIEVKTEQVDNTVQLGTAVKRREAKVVLRPARQANFSVAFPEKPSPKACGAFVKVTVTPPGSDWGLDVVQDGQACDTIGISTFWYDSSQTL